MTVFVPVIFVKKFFRCVVISHSPLNIYFFFVDGLDGRPYESGSMMFDEEKWVIIMIRQEQQICDTRSKAQQVHQLGKCVLFMLKQLQFNHF